MALDGVTTTDFTSNLLADLGVSVTHTPITKSIDNVGDETLTEGSTSTKTVFLHLGRPQNILSEEGEYENVVGYIMFSPSVTISYNDKITYNSRDYRVGRVFTRGAGLDKNVYQYAEIFIYNK